MKERTEIIKKPNYLEIDENDARQAILILQDSYKQMKLEHRLFQEGNYIPENIIALYLYFINCANYQKMVKDYKNKFIANESIVESGVTKEESEGLGIIYDYISNYDFNTKTPNIFIEGLKVHGMLYSKCPHPEYGGRLRDDSAIIQGFSYDVLTAEKARAYFQSFVTKQMNTDGNILEYIDESIEITASLIKAQPFPDGNKRTFRALLNLMLGKVGLPPVYIDFSERDAYKKALQYVFEDDNYEPIKRFYYYKICDAIVDLDINRFLEENTTPHR